MENNNLTNMKRMWFKIAYGVVTITILFEIAPKWFLHSRNGPYDDH